MQNRKLILVSSVAALVLCALPYGCSGSYVDGNHGNHGGSSPGVSGSCNCTDGSPIVYVPGGDGGGYVPPYNPGDGAGRSDGSRSDGSRSDGSRSDGGFVYGDGSPGDGGPGDGWGDGQPDPIDQSEGQADGWDPANRSEGQADGDSILP